MLKIQWVEKFGKTEIAVCQVSSRAALKKLNALEKKGWVINQNYCIDEIHGRPVRYYLRTRCVTDSKKQHPSGRPWHMCWL